MPKRTQSQDKYRYGFNGKEMDNEIHNSTGTSYDFGARMYDPGVGRWLACDPLAAKYTDLSPYQFVANMPIIAIDPDGERIGNPFSKYTRRYKKILKATTLGKILWKELRKNDKTFYFHPIEEYKQSISHLPLDEQFQHPSWNMPVQLEPYLGKVMPDTEYNFCQKTEDNFDEEIHLRFNPTTGLYEEIDKHWKKTHIMINEKRIMEEAEDLFFLTKMMNEDPISEESKEKIINSFFLQKYVAAIFEEVWHAARDMNNMDIYQTRYDQKTKRYYRLDKYKDYNERNHENKAKEEAEKATEEYFENTNN